MSKVCELKVLNRKNATLVVANRILAPNKSSDVTFQTIKQLEDAVASERNNLIKFLENIPEEINVKLAFPRADNGDVATESTEETVAEPQKEEVETKEEVVTETSDETPNEVKVLSRQEIIDMTAEELKDYAKENELDVKLRSNTSAQKTTEVMLEFYGYELEESAE